MQQLPPVFLWKKRPFIDAHSGRRAEVGAQNFRHHAGLLFVPVGLTLAARVVAIIAAGHDVANARLLIAVVVIVGDENRAEAIDARLVFIAEIVGDQFEVLAIHVTTPDRAGAAIGVVAGPALAFAVGRLEIVHSLIANAKVELPIRADEDAMNAMIVVEALKASEELSRRPVSFAFALAVGEDENIGRLADEDLVTRPDRIFGDRDPHRTVKLRSLIKDGRLIGFAFALGVFEYDDAIARGPIERLAMELRTIVHRLANPNAALVVDVEARRIGEPFLFGREKRDFKPFRDLECRQRLLGRHLGDERKS